jgi:hypothetical protein
METTDCTRHTCESMRLERVRFFPRQLLSANDLRDEQEYIREKLRRHNRMLHGWGIVCGLDVRPNPLSGASQNITICPGYALSPQGEEICVPERVEFDLAQRCPGSSADLCNEKAVVRKAAQNRTVYLAIRYAECMTRPVRTLPNGCGCDETACEYSRVRDGYEIACLDSLPDPYELHPKTRKIVSPEPPDLCESLLAGRVIPCPDCPKDPWVLLASITMSKDTASTGSYESYEMKPKAAESGMIVGTDCRRIIAGTAVLQATIESRHCQG